MARKRIAFIGSGNIGSTLALLAAAKDLGDCILVDIAAGLAEGKSLDLNQCTPIDGQSSHFLGSTDFSEIKDADVAIITAGIARKPGMSRDDLLSINASIIRQVGEAIRLYCPEAFTICITNPLDAMVQLLQKVSGLPTHMVCGMAGVLDCARFKYFLSQELNVSVKDVQALVLGGHGDVMVPLKQFCSVGGIPLASLVQMGEISNEKIEEIVERTRNGGAEIVSHLKTGSAFYAPAAGAIAMAESYLKDQKRLLPCAAYLTGQYSVEGLYIGVPCIVGGAGIERILEVPLAEGELQQFRKSVEAVRSLVAVALPKLEAKL